MIRTCSHCKLPKQWIFHHEEFKTDAGRPSGKKRFRIYVDEFNRRWYHSQCSDCQNLKVRSRRLRKSGKPSRGPDQRMRIINGELKIEQRHFLAEEAIRNPNIKDSPGLVERTEPVINLAHVTHSPADPRIKK